MENQHLYLGVEAKYERLLSFIIIKNTGHQHNFIVIAVCACAKLRERHEGDDGLM
jgi:hypothetical protein